MTFCPSCGASIETKDTYCPFCGAPTITEKKEEKSAADIPAEPVKPMQPIAAPGTITPVTSYPAATSVTVTHTLPQLEIRSFWIWTLLTMVTGGIAGYVYLYYNIEDLNKLDQYPKPAGVPNTRTDTSNLVILVIIGLCTGLISLIMLIATYMKFQKFHEYVKATPQRQTTIPISGTKFLLVTFGASICVGILAYGVSFLFLIIPDPMIATIVISIVSGILGLVYIGVLIYGFIQGANWQKAYNERARMLCPGTPEKSL
ncbi:MAG: zinc ribbon domain-containing protein [Candidatus Heimdallarchaeota archaeon]